MAASLSYIRATPYSVQLHFVSTGGDSFDLLQSDLSGFMSGPLKAILAKTADWTTLITSGKLAIRRSYDANGDFFYTTGNNPVISATSSFDIRFTPQTGPTRFSLEATSDVDTIIELRFVHSLAR